MSKPRFNREQLLFIVESIFSTMLSRMCEVLPPLSPIPDDDRDLGDRKYYCCAAQEVAGDTLAKIWGDLVDDGMSGYDALSVLHANDLPLPAWLLAWWDAACKVEFTDDEWNKVPLEVKKWYQKYILEKSQEGSYLPLDPKQMAEVFVKKWFTEYLEAIDA